MQSLFVKNTLFSLIALSTGWLQAKPLQAAKRSSLFLGLSQFAELIHPRWQASMSLGPGLQILPTRLNTDEYVNYASTKSTFEASSQTTAALLGSLTLIPLKTDFGAYEFTPMLGLNWLGKQSGHSRAFQHKLSLGYHRFYAVLGMQYVKKVAALNWFEQENASDGTLYRSYSHYNSKRKSIGIRYVYGDEMQNQLEASIQFEQFNSPGNEKCTGYGLSWSHNKTTFQLEYFPQHPALGNKYSDNTAYPAPKNLPKTGLYLQFSVRARLYFEKNYTE